MKILGMEFNNRADRKVLRIGEKLAEKIFDDGPVDREFVEDNINLIEGAAFTDKVEQQVHGIMGMMLWRASCNGFNDIIERISSKYKEDLVELEEARHVPGQCFWCAAIDGNVEGMKILLSHFESNIEDKDFSEALGRAAYHDNSPVIDYLLEDHGDRLDLKAVNNALESAAICASMNNINKLFAAKGDQITEAGIAIALLAITKQRQYGEDRYDFTSAERLLMHKKEQLFGTLSKPYSSNFTV